MARVDWIYCSLQCASLWFFIPTASQLYVTIYPHRNMCTFPVYSFVSAVDEVSVFSLNIIEVCCGHDHFVMTV